MKKPLLHLIFFSSGFAALGFQLMWTRIFAIGIGHELGSVLAVVSAFFGGLTLGAWLLEKPLARMRNPGYGYAALEGAIGCWGGLSLLVIPVANRLIFRWTGLDAPDLWRWTVCFAIPFVTLLPATFCMGATLPAMERAVAALTDSERPIPGLYSANTLGAVFGAFAAVFVVSPQVGFRATVLVHAGIALACSCSAFILARRFRRDAEPAPGRTPAPMRANRLAGTLFFTGLLGIGFEIVVTRALSQYFEDSVYTYASLLMVYLGGTASGAWAYHRRSSRAGSAKTLAFLLTGLCIFCLAGTALLPAVVPVDTALWKALGQGRIAHFTGEMAAAAVLFFLPTVCMGATFSHLAQEAKQHALGVGRALAVNTLGGALAPFLFGIVLLPILGVRATLIALGLGYCLLLPFKAMGSRFAIAALTAVLLPLAAALLIPPRLVTVAAGSKLLAYREGAMASVAVLEDEGGGRRLKVDNRFNLGGTQSAPTERLKTHLPLLLHPHPENALFIGLGTGITFGTVVDYKDVAADGVELDPVVVGMLPYFSPSNRSPFTGKYRVYSADARRFVRATSNTYDMILADFFHPYRDGSATLYTLEHFRAVRSRLRPGGLYCQWLPLYQLDMPSLRIIIRTFLQVFPHAQGYLGNFNAEAPGLALIGGEAVGPYPPDWFAKRVGDSGLAEMLGKEAIADEYTVPSFFLASQKDLEAIAGDAPLNTDNLPRVMFINPGFSGLKDFTPYGRLEGLLEMCKHDPADFAGSGADSATRAYRENLGQVLSARDAYLRGAIAEEKGNVEAATALYLRSAGMTGLFTVGYAKCLSMAMARLRENPEWAKEVLHKLKDMRPEFEEASEVLRDSFHE